MLIFERHSKIAKTIDETFTLGLIHTLQKRSFGKGKEAVKQTKLEIFITKTVQNSNLGT
jgi:hypothetical protein